MHRLGSILGGERIEEIVEIIFFRKSSFIKNHGVCVALIQFFIREQMAHLGPHLEGGFGFTVLIYQCRKGIVKILLWG